MAATDGQDAQDLAEKDDEGGEGWPAQDGDINDDGLAAARRNVAASGEQEERSRIHRCAGSRGGGRAGGVRGSWCRTHRRAHARALPQALRGGELLIGTTLATEGSVGGGSPFGVVRWLSRISQPYGADALLWCAGLCSRPPSWWRSAAAYALRPRRSLGLLQDIAGWRSSSRRWALKGWLRR